MSFFASKRSKAQAAAEVALRPVIIWVESEENSSELYYDPYVAGFISFVGSFFAKLAAPTIAGKDLGLAMRGALSSVCGVNGQDLSRHMRELTENNDELFSRGRHDGMIWSLYSVDNLKDEDDNPLVRSAKEIALSDGIFVTDYRSAVGGSMITLTLGSRVSELRGHG